MKVTVFGANGKVGRLVVAELLMNNHHVTAFVHSQIPFDDHPDLSIIKGDIYDSKTVATSIKDSEAVISALSSWHAPKKDILTAGMQNIIPAMKQYKVKRIISLTGHEAQSSEDPPSLFHRFIHKALSGLGVKVLADGDEHIRLLEASKLDWTVIRSPLMNNWGRPQNFKLARHWPHPWQTVHRKSVALAMVEQLTDKNQIRKAPFIVRSRA